MERFFVSTSRLFEKQAYEKLCNYRIGIIGLGGVGSWIAEALTRSGIKKLVLIDYDHVSESNINRQVQATTNSLGFSKIEALSNRLLQINPNVNITPHEVFFSQENSFKLLEPSNDLSKGMRANTSPFRSFRICATFGTSSHIISRYFAPLDVPEPPLPAVVSIEFPKSIASPFDAIVI